MSTETERVEDGTETSLLETWEDWYHLPILGAVMLFMFWVRTQSYDRFVTEDGTAALAGVDSWYHWRTVQWTAENYPSTMPYEIWTSFPTGRYVGQFGTLFDQLIVTVAMIVGLGDPSTETLYMVSLFAVPAMAALVAIPVFYVGRRLGGTLGGIVSVLLLALAPGQFLTRTTAGQLQHHVAEVLFMAIAVLAMMVALRVAEREQPIYELVVDRDWETLREPTIYSVLAGIALALYIWVWPPGIVLIGILAVFFTIQLCLDYVRNVSPDHVAYVGAVSLGVTALITALLIEEPGTSVTSFGYLQPVSAALVAVGCVFMAWLARQWNASGIDRRYYPVAIGGLIVGAFAAMAVVLPDLYSTFVGNFTSRVLPLDPGTGAQTIQEAQPPGDFGEHVFSEFGAAFYTMVAGLALLVARPYLGREYRTEYTLVLVWSLFLISMAATQVRFAYYLVLAVAVVNAVFVAEVVRFFDFDVRDGVDSIRQVEAYQIIILLVVAMLLFAPLLPPVAAEGTTAMDRGEMAQPHHDAMTWEDSNHWLQENTPEPGNWGDAEYADELELYGTYEYPEGENYAYPDGTYGVLSWWDYGHLITTQAERIPHSNPFQSGATSSSEFLTAESEEHAELTLDAIALDESPEDSSTDELRELVGDADPDEEIRYVMIDDAMVAGKFSAIASWTEPGPDHYTTPPEFEPTDQIPRDEIPQELSDMPYYDTAVAQLYFDDASGMEHYRLVHESDAQPEVLVSYAIVDSETDNVVVDDGAPQVFVNQNYAQAQAALNFYDQHPQLDYEIFDDRLVSPVKTYERVDGATLTGSVDDLDADLDDDATVTAAVELDTGVDRDESETPLYAQEAELEDDGSFELTVSYATNDELGVEDGYTDSAVETVDDYEIVVETGGDTYEAQQEVPETAVVEGETLEVEFESADDD
ncbi:oligosaccharyl transferase, archaeosortase A system-associated [Natronobacterium gregoryi]|uniref:dolichyl-phosphooligosaccharide-protein glycotransferase n=2 Tax=Natronobacterium gregoryi TaxID=44930 RepID=L0AJQ7_NATGS|nr:oligosaccharyl transferase, archaeosortase A system-associated [Natronobacterium gregoryi]AFZ73422.1 oligosaccharyl transferase, archaeosortase system-associated [Natronobacterium gregoryi SP2]ELY68618.1 oligosaccharyl transferase STT3 subunit [Natronobacterium gregoryi SP2]PLK18486.1 oligosaccharyl transferase, archaeosortase A system-associated [Natronobacterium gregoryi SP2]SFI72355.1 dolichyl-diphosphooligosaccharide--protein glycosyltransferase [Natronobacterium gregoryi]